MRIRLWGVRGSIATPIPHEHLRSKLQALLSEASPGDLANPAAIDAYLDRSEHSYTFGGNTSCVEVDTGDAVFICDAGTGIRGLGGSLIADGRAHNKPLHVLLTHFHWDHICGFPFFGPIYNPKLPYPIRVMGGRSDGLALLAGQMGSAYFPVKWDRIPAQVTYEQLPVEHPTEVSGARISLLPMIHPDKAFGYRIDAGGRSMCYLTDTEISKDPHRLADVYAPFVHGADVVIVDAMYGFLEYHEHVNFGHSTIYNWIDFFRDTPLGELVIFHHDPMASDHDIRGLCATATRYRELVAPDAKWKISAAREGQTWEF